MCFNIHTKSEGYYYYYYYSQTLHQNIPDYVFDLKLAMKWFLASLFQFINFFRQLIFYTKFSSKKSSF